MSNIFSLFLCRGVEETFLARCKYNKSWKMCFQMKGLPPSFFFFQLSDCWSGQSLSAIGQNGANQNAEFISILILIKMKDPRKIRNFWKKWSKSPSNRKTLKIHKNWTKHFRQKLCSGFHLILKAFENKGGKKTSHTFWITRILFNLTIFWKIIHFPL